MQNIVTDELLGLFESIDDNNTKIDTHKETIKMLNADSAEQFKTFAEEKEIKLRDLKDAYKYYQRRHNDGEESSDDFFTLCALVDNAADADAEDEEDVED